MTTTVDTILARFDNGSGFTNKPGDGIIADREIQAAGGYKALAAEIEQLANPADADRIVQRLDPGSKGAKQSLMEAMAPKLAARGMLQNGSVVADAVYGRREEYRTLRAELSPQAARVVTESPATAEYMKAPSDVGYARLFTTSMARASANPTYWLTAAHAFPSLHPANRAELFKGAMAAATAPGARDFTVAYARYAAAVAAQTDGERAQVLAIPKVGLNPAGERRWQEATAIASTSPADVHAIHTDALRRADDAGGNAERLQYLSTASTAARSPEERAAVAQRARAVYDELSQKSNQRFTYAALGIVLRNTPAAERQPLIAQAEAAFARAPAEADSTLRQVLAAYGCEATRSDIVAGANMAYAKSQGPRKDQVLALTAAYDPTFNHFY